MKICVVTENQSIRDKIKTMQSKIEKFDFNYSEVVTDREYDIYLITENNDFEDSSDMLDDIRKACRKKRAVIIVIGRNTNAFNVVKWMRGGIADYLPVSDLREDTLKDSIIGSVKYIIGDLKNVKVITGKGNAYGKRITVSKNNNWNSLKNNHFYDMSLVMVSLSFSDDAAGRYSKASFEKITLQIKDEMSRAAAAFGGDLWFWNNDSGILTFHFGDYINASVLASIYIITHFFLFCVEKLKLDEVLKIKLSVHKGNCFYNKTNTESITSDLINSIVHLQHQFNTPDNLCITEQIYSSVSPRISEYFEKSDFFEGNMIYKLLR